MGHLEFGCVPKSMYNTLLWQTNLQTIFNEDIEEYQEESSAIAYRFLPNRSNNRQINLTTSLGQHLLVNIHYEF